MDSARLAAEFKKKYRTEEARERDKIMKVRYRLQQRLVSKFAPGKTNKEIAAYTLEVG